MNSPRMPYGRGPDVDFATGVPRPEVDLAKMREQKAHLQDLASRQQGLRINLLTEQSNVVLERLATELSQRIDRLVELDPECQALLRVLGHFREELSIGKRAAEALMKPLYEQI